MLQNNYGRLAIVSVFVIIAIILIMAPGMQSNKRGEEQLNFTSMPKENVSQAQSMSEETSSANTPSAVESVLSPEDQMLDAWGMNKPKSKEKNVLTEEVQNEETPTIQEQPEVAQDVEDTKETKVVSGSASGEAEVVIPKTYSYKFKPIKVNGKCFVAPEPVVFMPKAECDAAKLRFGIKRCAQNEDDKDMWAGAVRQCGGVNKMPDVEDLAAIARLLYSKPSINISESTKNIYSASNKTFNDRIDCGSTSFSGLAYDNSIAKEYGYPENGGYSIWGKYELGTWYGLSFLFEDTKVRHDICTTRNSENSYAVCQVECPQ